MPTGVPFGRTDDDHAPSAYLNVVLSARRTVVEVSSREEVTEMPVSSLVVMRVTRSPSSSSVLAMNFTSAPLTFQR